MFNGRRGLHCQRFIVTVDHIRRGTLLRLSADAILELVGAISAIVAKQTEKTEACLDAAFRVLPYQLIVVQPREFSEYLQHLWKRLDFTFGFEKIKDFRHQSKELCEWYQH